MNEEKGLLRDIFVLDLADERGSFCSKLLADLGATVIKIEHPEANPERKIGPLYRLKNGECISLSFAYHNANKLGIFLDPRTEGGKKIFYSLVKKADVLIETLPSHQLGEIDLSPQRLRRANPGLVHLSITGFGRSGPKRHYRFSDIIGSAAGGQLYLSGPQAGPPSQLPGLQSCYMACLHGAIVVLLTLRRRKITGRGSYFDLSIQEAVASTLDHVMVDYFHEQRIAKRQGHHYQGQSFSIVQCQDGFFQISILRDWETLIELINSQGKSENLLQPQWQHPEYRQNHYDHISDVVERWTRTWEKERLFELGQAMRFPWAPVASPREVIDSPQLKARRFLVQIALPGTRSKLSAPGIPYKFSRLQLPLLEPAPLPGEHTEQVIKKFALSEKNKEVYRQNAHSICPAGKILKGIRVVDLTRMLSGPLATRILADFGAEVIKVQSAVTSQGAERNDTAQFAALNRNKRSISLNLDHEASRHLLRRLVAISDVVVENYSPRVMANWNLTYEQLKKVRPDIIMASISAMGSQGPWKDYIGFAPTIHALSGFLFLMPRSQNRPVNLGHAYGDVVAALYASLAILSALEYRDHTGEGCYIDLSAYEALCTLLGPEYMKADLDRRSNAGKAQNECLGGAAPDGCYPCKGNDRWCAISIRTGKQWNDFCRIAKQNDWLSSKYSSLEGRIRNRVELDASIARWTVQQNAETLVKRLQRAAIPAAVVQNAEDLAKDPHLAARRFFVSIKHPQLGPVRCDRSALWPSRQSTKKWKSAPLLGEDNNYVFVELLGMSNTEVRSLREQGAIR